MDFDLENPLSDLLDDHADSVASLFLIESDHMPSQNYFLTLQDGDFDISVRREAIASVSQVQSFCLFFICFCGENLSSIFSVILNLCFFFQFSCNFDPLVSYLAVNYIDRFLSRHGMLVNKHIHGV